MNVYLIKDSIEGRTKYYWDIRPSGNVVATLEVKEIAADVDLTKIIAQTPSIWIKCDLKVENQQLDQEAAELRKELAGFMEA